MIKFCKRCGCDTIHYKDYKCKVCKGAYTKAYREKNAEAVAATQRKWEEANRERRKELRRNHYIANREASIAATKKWIAENREHNLAWRRQHREVNRERVAAKKREWNRANPGRVAGHNRARAAGRKQATVSWADQQKIAAIYSEAAQFREAGIDVHVDHLVPLKHPLVCGLHNEFNLRIVSAHENMSKHNQLLDSLPETL